MKQPGHVLITGAAGAIGSALVQQFADRYPHAKLTLIDVNRDKLNAFCELLGARAHGLAWDLFQPDSLAPLWKNLVEIRGPVDVLVNCAGIMDIMSFGGTGWERGWKLLAVNMISPLRLMDLALADMPAGSCIVNVSSMAGRVPIKGCTYYGGAKAGIAMASEIAHSELKSRDINVITVYPGPVHSGLEAHARSQVKQGVISKFIPTGKPDVIAQKVVDAYENEDARVIYPTVYGLAHVMNTLASWITANVSPQPLR